MSSLITGTVPERGSLELQRQQYAASRFLAMPIAGTLAWIVVGLAGLFIHPRYGAYVLFIATGSIFYFALLIAKFTGEDLLGRSRPRNLFDRIFLSTIGMACLVYAIAIPFFLVEPTSLPLTVGILTGLMWLPFAVLIGHWIGLFHAIVRTILVVAAWYLFPQARYVTIPAVIVGVYLITLFVLAKRARPAANG